MKKITQMKKFMLCAGIFGLVIGFTGCSDDDDEVTMGLPTEKIQVEDWQSLSGNILTVHSVTVNQDSWLAAVEVGDEDTNNFIAQPVLVEKGTSSNVQLIFDESVVNYRKHYAEVVLKLYVDNLDGGIKGEWDESDKPIVLTNNILLIKTITIMADLTDYIPFRHLYDENGDGTLDLNEVSKTYVNHFHFWDSEGDGYLTRQEFYDIQFYNADSDYNTEISLEEWNEGYLRMFGNWANKDFSAFDEDKNGKLSWNEWNKFFEESEWFETYDTNSDNLITEQELNEGYFGDWDLNDDGKIDEDEFNNYQPYVSYWEYWYWFE